MITTKDIDEKQRKHGYDWHNAYLACLIERQAQVMFNAVFLPGLAKDQTDGR